MGKKNENTLFAKTSPSTRKFCHWETPPIICFCRYQNGKNIITTVIVVLTFSTSSGSMQMSCNERFKGIALMFKGEVEPVGITRTSISYFFLCSAQDARRVISRKQSKRSFPKLNTVGLNNLVKAGLCFSISALHTLCFSISALYVQCTPIID